MVKSNISERIRQAIRQTGKSQAEIAEAVGVSNPAVTKWLKSGSIAIETLIKLAQVTSCSFEWLATGHDMAIGNVSHLPAKHKVVLVPLLSWVQAGDFCDNPEIVLLDACEEMLPCPVPIGPKGYALRVQGDSMTSIYPGGRSYPAGCIIYVDPDKPVTNGARVVAYIEGTNEVTFKVYVEDAGEKFLKPINPQYRNISITKETRICGVVVCKMTPE